MKYLIFKKDNSLKKGNKVKVLITKFNAKTKEIEEELLEEFVLNDFDYYPQEGIYVISSPLDLSTDELEKRMNSNEVILEIS